MATNTYKFRTNPSNDSIGLQLFIYSFSSTILSFIHNGNLTNIPLYTELWTGKPKHPKGNPSSTGRTWDSTQKGHWCKSGVTFVLNWEKVIVPFHCGSLLQKPDHSRQHQWTIRPSPVTFDGKHLMVKYLSSTMSFTSNVAALILNNCTGQKNWRQPEKLRKIPPIIIQHLNREKNERDMYHVVSLRGRCQWKLYQKHYQKMTRNK